MRPETGGPGRVIAAYALSLVVVLLVLSSPINAGAQTPQPKPPISPARALISSMLIPGLAQARLDRATGLLFATTEAIALAMYGKSKRAYDLARSLGRDSTPAGWIINTQTGQPIINPETGQPTPQAWLKTRYETSRIRARKTHVEDWIAVLVFNHLFAGVDGFVAAQLWELPANVEMKSGPRGTTISANIRW